MNLRRALITFTVIFITLTLIHFGIICNFSVSDVSILYNIYGVMCLISIPIFGVYLFLQINKPNLLSYSYIFFSVLKSIVTIVWVSYLIKLLDLDVQKSYFTLMIATLIFSVAELIPLFKWSKEEINE